MMNVVGLMRVKNEARWIEASIRSILPICDRVMVLDDHSTDDTAAICETLPAVSVVRSPFDGLNEARDKNYLLDLARGFDWAVMIDGDEVLAHADVLRAAIEVSERQCLSLPVWYLWDTPDQMRVDGVYGNFRRQSVFRPGTARFHDRGAPNFHCGNVPAEIRQDCGYVSPPLLHYGYMHREDRLRKYEWYRSQDPNNAAEDEYRHIVVGDVFPIESKFRHGGPLTLKSVWAIVCPEHV